LPKDEKKLMFKRKHRVPKGTRFGKSRLGASPLFTVKIKENGLLFNRFSTVVSKKVDKRSVVRNRVRRLVYSCLMELYGGLKQGYDMIITVKKNTAFAKRTQLCKEIERVLNL